MDLARYIFLASKEDEMIRREQSTLYFTVTCHMDACASYLYEYTYKCIPVEDGVIIEGSFPFTNQVMRKTLFSFLVKRSDRRIFYNGCFVLYEGLIQCMKEYFDDAYPDVLHLTLRNKTNVLYNCEVVLTQMVQDERHSYLLQNLQNKFKDIFGILVCLQTSFAVAPK
jgi:hypothetical protein